MPTTEKEQRVRELTEAISRSKSIVLTDFTGMNVVWLIGAKSVASGVSLMSYVVIASRTFAASSGFRL